MASITTSTRVRISAFLSRRQSLPSRLQFPHRPPIHPPNLSPLTTKTIHNHHHHNNSHPPHHHPHRHFTTTPHPRHGQLTPPPPGSELHITFIDKDNTTKHTYAVSEGDNLLDIAQANDLEMEGACGGSAACSTCHVIVTDQEMYDKLPEPSDDENDMLDLAFGLTETSRLGCQVKMEKAVDGLVVKLPSMTRNLQSKDFEKK